MGQALRVSIGSRLTAALAACDLVLIFLFLAYLRVKHG